MKQLMEYNGYHAKILFDANEERFVGEIIDVKDMLEFRASTVKGLKEGFRICIDSYVQACEKKGIKPEKEYNGVFNVRVSSEIHRKASLAAMDQGITLNQFVADAIAKAVKYKR